MNKLIAICGLMLLGSVSAMGNCETVENVPTSTSFVMDSECKTNPDLDLKDIVFIEEEPQIELGFDTVDYLPEGFDPYQMYVDLNTIEFIEEHDEISLGFNVAEYLPSQFDPYAYPSDIDGINYIDEADQFELGFDTTTYLPEDFDPYTVKDNPKEVTLL